MKSMKEIQIDVLMAIHNKENEKYFDQCMLSLLHQTYNNFRIIMILDGPIRSELVNIIEKYKQIGLNINTYQTKLNYGLAYAMNIGLDLCKSNYIARMDSDDIAMESRFEEQLSYLLHHNDIDVVGSWIEDIDEGGRSLKVTKYPESHEDCYRMFRKRNPLAHPSAMFRKRYFDKAGKYKESIKIDQDSILWMEGFRAGAKFANIQKVLLKFRITHAALERRKHSSNIYLRNRIRIIRNLRFGFFSYIYALLMVILYNLPLRYKVLIYKKFR